MQQQIFMESGSSIGTFMDCPKLYEFKYIKKFSSATYPQALGYGSFIHALVETIHKKEPLPEDLLSPDSRVRLEVDKYLSLYPKSQDQILLDAALALGVVREWHNHWYLNRATSDDLGPHQAQVEASEREWQFPLTTSSSNVHVGKSDGVIDHKTYGKKFLYELKTSGDPDRNAYKHKLELDKQINSNLIAMKKDGYEPAGVLYDIIWKPAIRLKKDRKTMPDETQEEFYERIKESSLDKRMISNLIFNIDQYILLLIESDLKPKSDLLISGGTILICPFLLTS